MVFSRNFYTSFMHFCYLVLSFPFYSRGRFPVYFQCKVFKVTVDLQRLNFRIFFAHNIAKTSI